MQSPRRRWFQYSLRSFLILLTGLAVWLGVIVNRAREQREAVEAIEALGGKIEYGQSGVPEWFRRLIGDEYLLDVWAVDLTGWTSKGTPPFSEANVERAIPHLKRLRKLDAITIRGTVSMATVNEIQGLLPCSTVGDFFGDSKIVYTEHAMQHYQQ